MKQRLINSLNKFQQQYPNTTSGDIQTFVMGWMAAVEAMIEMNEEQDETGEMDLNETGMYNKK